MLHDYMKCLCGTYIYIYFISVHKIRWVQKFKSSWKQHPWTEEDIQNAIHELDSLPGKSFREVVKQFGLSESTIRFRRKNILAGSDIRKAGKKCTFDQETDIVSKMHISYL